MATMGVVAIRTIWAGMSVLLVSASAEGLIVPMIRGGLLDASDTFARLMLWMAADHKGAWAGAVLVILGALRLARLSGHSAEREPADGPSTR